MHTSKYQICSLYKCSFILIDSGYFHNDHMIMGITIKVDDQTRRTVISQSEWTIQIAITVTSMLVTKCVGYIYEMLVTVLTILVTNIHYLYQLRPPHHCHPQKLGDLCCTTTHGHALWHVRFWQRSLVFPGMTDAYDRPVWLNPRMDEPWVGL